MKYGKGKEYVRSSSTVVMSWDVQATNLNRKTGKETLMMKVYKNKL